MKVLIATPLYPPDIGGPATYAHTLFSELPKRGIDVSMVSFGSVRKYPSGIRHAIYSFKLFIKALSCDVIYALDPVSVGLPALFVSKILHKRLVLKIVGDFAWEQAMQGDASLSLDEFVKSNASNAYDNRIMRLKRVQSYVAIHADKIVVPSNYLKSIIEQWGVPPTKIIVVYNSFSVVTPNTFIEKKLGKIVTAGRLVRWKGFDTLILAMPKIVSVKVHAHLHIIGSGPDLARLRNLVVANGLSKCVTLTPAIDKSSLHREISEAEVFCLVSNYEGLSHVLLETMALKTPIVTSSVGGNKELLGDGALGTLIPYGNADMTAESIIEIMNKSTEELREMTSAAYKKTSDFSEEKMINGVIEVLS